MWPSQPLPPMPPKELWDTWTAEQRGAFHEYRRSVAMSNARWQLAWGSLYCAAGLAGVVGFCLMASAFLSVLTRH